MSEYYIGKNNERLGPFPLEKLISNGLTPDSLVWCQGMPGWKRATEVPEVAALFAPQPRVAAGQSLVLFKDPHHIGLVIFHCPPFYLRLDSFKWISKSFNSSTSCFTSSVEPGLKEIYGIFQ